MVLPVFPEDYSNGHREDKGEIKKSVYTVILEEFCITSSTVKGHVLRRFGVM